MPCNDRVALLSHPIKPLRVIFITAGSYESVETDAEGEVLTMGNVIRWPCKLAAVLAVLAGVLMLLGGGGHLSAVLEARAGQPFDYRFVSLLTTSGILMFPGVVSLLACYWLWHGRVWAYVSCLLSTSALMLYLSLLVYMKTQVQEGATAAGPEVYFFVALTSAYFVVIAGVLLWLQQGPNAGALRGLTVIAT